MIDKHPDCTSCSSRGGDGKCFTCHPDPPRKPTNWWKRKPLGGYPRPEELRDERPMGQKSATPSVTCIDCPIHLEGPDWLHLKGIGGKPIVCTPLKKNKGCGNAAAREQRVRIFRRYQAKYPKEETAPVAEEVEA